MGDRPNESEIVIFVRRPGDVDRAPSLWEVPQAIFIWFLLAYVALHQFIAFSSFHRFSSLASAPASRYTQSAEAMCIYDYTPYVGCHEGEQHFYLQWMKCNKAAGRSDKYCSLEKSVPAEELRKLSGNVLRCPIHLHIAVYQHELEFVQEKGDVTISTVVNDEAAKKPTTIVTAPGLWGSGGTVGRNSPSVAPVKERGPTSERPKEESARSSPPVSMREVPKLSRFEDDDEPSIDFGEEVRREAREKKARETSRRSSRQTSPNGLDAEPIPRPKNPSAKTFERYDREDSARNRSRHRRGGSEDLQPHRDDFKDREEPQRPRSYQSASKHKARTHEEEPLPSPRRIPPSPRSPQSPEFDTDLPNDSPVGLPAKPNVYRHSTIGPRVDDDDTNTQSSRTRRPSSLRNTPQSDSTDDVPETPSPRRISRRPSAAGHRGTEEVLSLRKIEERSDAEKERDQRARSSDRRRERSASVDRKPSRAPSSNRGRERDILDRLRDERPDPTSNLGVTRHRRQASIDVPTSASTQTSPNNQPNRSRSRSADPQPQPSRTHSTDRHRSSSQTSVSRNPTTTETLLSRKRSTSKEPSFSKPPSRAPSRGPSPSHSTSGPARPLPAVPGQTHWSAELTRRNSGANNYVHTVPASRKWTSPPPSASPASPVSPVSPESPGVQGSTSQSSPATASSQASPGKGQGNTVRWNLPHQPSESGVGLLAAVDSPTLGGAQPQPQVQSLGQGTGAGSRGLQGGFRGQGGSARTKRESHDSGYGNHRGHLRGQSTESSPGMEISGALGVGPATNGKGVEREAPAAGVSQQGLASVARSGITTVIAPGIVGGQKKLVKTKGNDLPSLPSPPYGTKLNVSASGRPLPDAAYLPLPGEERGGGLVSKKSLGKLKMTFSGLLDKGKGRKVTAT